MRYSSDVAKLSEPAAAAFDRACTAYYVIRMDLDQSLGCYLALPNTCSKKVVNVV